MRGAYFAAMWCWCWLCFNAYVALPSSRSHHSAYGKLKLWLSGFAGMYACSPTYRHFTNCNYFTDRIGL
jgi:hypothetical protein